MRHLCIHVNTNTLIGTAGGSATPRFKRDGDYFTREAQAYQKHWEKKGDQVFRYGISARQKFMQRLWEFSKIIGDFTRTGEPVDVLAYWGHGYQRGIQLGFSRKAGAQAMARNIRGLGVKHLILYACSCAKGSENFMKWIAEELIRLKYRDFVLLGHDRRGDTMRNPFVVAYRPDPEMTSYADVQAQIQRIEFKDIMEPAAFKAWRENLKSDLRFEFPFMEIENEKKWF